MILSLLVAFSMSTDGDSQTAQASNIDSTIPTDVMVEDFTNTIVFVVEPSQTETAGNQVTETYVVDFVATLFKIMKVYEATPTATAIEVPPTATEPLKSFVFKPGIMIGCTFGVAFVVGFVYTELCRKPAYVYAPPPKEVRKSSSSSLSDIDKKKKKKAASGKGKVKSGKGKVKSGKGGVTKHGKGDTQGKKAKAGSSNGNTKKNTKGKTGNHKARSKRV